MGRVIARAHSFGLRVILCNSRSAAGRGPEIASGLWYTAAYPEAVWQADWKEVVSLFGHDTAFVGADLRNEPHEMGSGTVAEQTYLTAGPMWGTYRGTQYWHRDWRLAAEHMGNDLLRVDPTLLIIVEGVQVYVDPSGKKVSGGLWGSNLSGVRYAPVRLIRPGQLVYSVHEYGPQMWQGDWFNTKTTYASLSRRWTRLWGYLLNASRSLQAPIFVGEFGTCHEYWSCITATDGWKQGFWFKSFVQYLHGHPQVGWAYWSLNPTGPFHAADTNFYSLVSTDWQHYYPLVTRGLAPLLSEPDGTPAWRPSVSVPSFTPMPGCSPNASCTFASPLPSRAAPLLSFTVKPDVPYVPAAGPNHFGDLYLPQTSGTVARPAVIIVHGGTWDNGQKGTPGTIILAQALAQHGFVAFDINYRLAGQGGEYPRNIRDVDDAAAYLTTQKDKLHIDTGKLAVVGVSSGGYLALMAAYRSGVAPFIAPHYRGVHVRIRAVGAFFAPVELKSSIHSAGDRPWVQNLETYMGASYDRDPDRYKMASPLRYADTGVPTIFWYAGADPITPTPQMFELYKRLKQRQVLSELLDLPGSPRHLTDLSHQARQTAFVQLVGFLDGVLNYRQAAAG
jgi:acetyl esterase/lipase